MSNWKSLLTPGLHGRLLEKLALGECFQEMCFTKYWHYLHKDISLQREESSLVVDILEIPSGVGQSLCALSV